MMARSRPLVAAAFVILLLDHGVAASDDNTAGGARGKILAQAKPVGLPSAPSSIPTLHRGADGKIEVVDPTKTEVPGAARGPCSETAICVGPGLAYPTLAKAVAAARAGDVIEVVPGTYHETFAVTQPRVVIRGFKGRAHVDCAGLRPVSDKACILLAAADVTLVDLEISGAQAAAAAGGNAACVRNEPDLDFKLDKIFCHASQNGLLTNGGRIVIENSEFSDNGWDGQTHNAYFSGNCLSVTVRNSKFHDARVGHEFKSRCAVTAIANTSFHAVKGSRALDLPDGGAVTVDDGEIRQEATVQNAEMIGFAAESCRVSAKMTVRATHIVGTARSVIHNFGLCEHQPIELIGVKFDRVRPDLQGEIVVK
ncbi:MAG: hypothetical protein JWL84_3293 [Rhodospirillales bacterium]|nr:hypothetical protein [Rhodospirillales bacterium]